MAKTRAKYNREFPATWTDLDVEIYAFYNGLTKEDGALGKAVHFKNIIEMQYTQEVFRWHDWVELMIDALCRYKYVMFDGAASTGKSSIVALWNVVNWCCHPSTTTCVFTSTSLPALEKRTWGEVMKWHRVANIKWPGQIMDSDMEVRISATDKKSVMYGVAVKSGGSVTEAVDRIIGVHNPRMFVNIDEMTSVPRAIVNASRNLNKGTKEFQFIGMGNADSHLDPHGEFCEPEMGWNSISIDSDFWLTKRGCCVRLDGLKSPAILEPDKFPFLINKQQIDEDERFYGGQSTAEFIRFCRGFWVATGSEKTVITSDMIEQFHMKDKVTWLDGYKVCAGFDPSFEGGDRKILYPARHGFDMNKKYVIEYQEPIIISVDSTDPKWLHYKIAEKVKNECEKIGVDPIDFSMDTTGEGGGLFTILAREWSEQINGTEFGGRASSTQVSDELDVPAYEKYYNRVSELWFSFRLFAIADQIRGITNEALIEFCTRKYKMTGRLIQVEPKQEMKKTLGRSPDIADSATIVATLLRSKGINPGSHSIRAATKNTGWLKQAKKFDIYNNENNFLEEAINS